MRRRTQTFQQQISPLIKCQRQTIRQALTSMNEIEVEAIRVADILRNTRAILDELDEQFEEKTSLSKMDIKFLFLATGLQCLRQYVFSNDAFRFNKHDDGDKLIGRIVPKKWHDVLLASVPYDATKRSIEFDERTGLSGFTHRYRTLGHDPILGWFFGPVNIITDSLTKSDIITTYSVTDKKISGAYQGGTFGAISDCISSINVEKKLLPVAVMRQALHFGADYFTKQGLPVPILPSLNNDMAASLVTKFNIDMYSITRGATLAILINAIIGYIHTLFYKEEHDGSPAFFEVRTRKILTYSNILASASNIIAVAVQSFMGNAAALKQLDIGGLFVTLYRILTDYRYVYQIKADFLSNQLYSTLMSDSHAGEN